MSALKKFLPGKRKTKKSTSSSIKSSVSEQNIADFGNVPGYKNVKEKDLPKFHKAAWLGDLAKLKQLVRKSDVNSMDRHHRTPLHYACVKGHSEVAQWLCANRANLGICDEDGRTALTKAVETASEACVEILLNHGAEVNVVDVNLTTPLHIAATHGNIPIATLLLERDARVNAPDNEKITPLYVAASLNFPEFVEFLLKEYALVNEGDVYGRTPLIAAAMEGHKKVVEILLHYGADTEVKDKEGWKAIDHSAMTGNHNIAEVIENQTEKEDTEVPIALNPIDATSGSGVGSPFKSTSTHQSSYGGPAINITADSEDDSIGNESPKRSDFKNSWADSDSEFEIDEKNIGGPNLANAFKRDETTESKSSVSKIPIATSKDKSMKTDDKEYHVDDSLSKSESKIPRLGFGAKKITAKSNEDISISPIQKVEEDKDVPNHRSTKGETGPMQLESLKQEGSKIPRLNSASSKIVDKLVIEKTYTGLRDGFGMKSDETSTGKSLGWDNASVSDFESESEDFSETDILAALTGSPTKKVEKRMENSFVKGSRHLLGDLTHPEMDESDEVAEGESPSEGKLFMNKEEIGQDATVEDGLQNDIAQAKENHSDGHKDESDWESTTEDISIPKPNLNELMEGNGAEEEEEKKENSNLEDDSLISIAEKATPDVSNKVKEVEDKKVNVGETKEKSEFGGFSLDKRMESNKSQGIEKSEEITAGGYMHHAKDVKAKIEELGTEDGSSFSSFSENESFKELDSSFINHGDIIPTTKHADYMLSIEEEPAKLNQSNLKSQEEEIAEQSDHKTDEHKKLQERKSTKKDAKDEKSKSTKNQYDALGIDLSEESESLETESEWEATLRKRRERENAKTESFTGEEKAEEELGTEEIVGGPMLASTKSHVDEMETEKESEKRDSEFISDESFSLNTEDQLEDLEEERLKKINVDEDLSRDFGDSDFSLSENSQNQNSNALKKTCRFENEIDFEKDALGKLTLSQKSDEESKRGEIKEEKVEDEIRSILAGESVDESDISDDKSIFNGNKASRSPDGDSAIDSNENSDGDCAIDRRIAHSETVKEDTNGLVDLEREDEKAVFLKNIVSRKNSAVREKKEEKVDGKRKMSDVERKKSLEAILNPMKYIQTESIKREVATVEVDEMEANADEISKDERIHVQRKDAYYSKGNEVEEEFERNLEEKETGNQKPLKLEEGSTMNGSDQHSFEETESEEEIEVKMQLSLKGEKEPEMEKPELDTINLEKGEMKFEIEMKIKRHQEELRQKERDFEAELRRKENEERGKRQRQSAEIEKERKKIDEIQRLEKEWKEKEIIEERKMRIKLEAFKRKKLEESQRNEKDKKKADKNIKEKFEEELRYLEEERNRREKKTQEMGIMGLEEAVKKRREEEMKVIESAKRLKQQEDFMKKMREKIDKSSNSGDDVDDERREIYELSEIGRFMKEQEEAEKKRKSEKVFREDVIQNFKSSPIFSARDILQEEQILPVQSGSHLIQTELTLEPLRTRSPEQRLKENGVRLGENSRKMKQEAEMLLEAARHKTNALLRGERREGMGAGARTSPRQKQFASDELSDYGSADVDEMMKLKDDVYPMIQTPGSDAVDSEMPPYQRTSDYPTVSTPHERYDTHMFDYNDHLSPIIRSTSAPLIMDQNDRALEFKHGTPVALYTSLSQTGHFQDSKALMKVQEALKESKRETDRARDRNTFLENARREVETDLREMQRTVEVLSQSQSDLEKVRLDMEMEMRNMKYRLDNETQGRMAAEGLISQLRDQLKRGDEKYASEAEARQAIELAYKTLESEFKKRENLIHQFENEVNDLRFAFHHEREARVNQEQMYKDQLQQHESLLEETQKTSLHHMQTLSTLEMTDQNRQSAESTANQLKLDLAKNKGELVRVAAQLEEVKSTYENEVARLRDKLQEKMDELVKSEREQFQAQMQIEADKATAKAEQMRLMTSLDNEVANRKRAESELNVLKTQLQNANTELERVMRTKTLTESEANKFKEESYKDRSKHDREIATSKDEFQRILVKVDSTERRCSALESELQSAKIDVAQKSGQLIMSSRELDHKTNLLHQIEEKFKHEKELNQRLASRIDNGSERSSVLQRELDSLRKQLEAANQRTADGDKAARDTQDKFSALLAKAKEDFDKERLNQEHRLLQMNDVTMRYKEEHAEDKDIITAKEKEIRMIQKELNDLSKTSSAVEAAKEIQSKMNERLEEDNLRLSRQTAVLEKELKEVKSLKCELERNLEDLKEQLEHALRVSDHTSNKLMKKNSYIEQGKLSRGELEKEITRLKVAKAEMESELREEKSKCELILDDLRKSDEARESLEKILASLKITNVHLEEKLQSETLSRAQHERDAEDHKGLWNSELKSRSRLGLQLLTMEKEIQKLKSALEDEKRRTIQFEEMKRTLESKMDHYETRINRHQKESIAMKSKLRQYQRRIKDIENIELRIPKVYSELEKERDVMLNNSSNLRRQVESLTDQLRKEQESRSLSDSNASLSDQALSDLRAKEKALSYEKERLERENEMLEDELERLKDFYERNYIEKSNLDSFKREIETKARLEINQKLQDVNAQLEEQAAAREAYDRVRNEAESKCKKEFEETINGLKSELSHAKSALQEGIIKSNTYGTETNRIRELYKHEVGEKQKLSERFEKLNKRTAQLSIDKPHSSYTTEQRGSTLKSGNSLFLSAERDEQDSRPSLHLSDVTQRAVLGSFTAPNLRSNSASRDYFPSYRHHYLSQK